MLVGRWITSRVAVAEEDDDDDSGSYSIQL